MPNIPGFNPLSEKSRVAKDWSACFNKEKWTYATRSCITEIKYANLGEILSNPRETLSKREFMDKLKQSRVAGLSKLGQQLPIFLGIWFRSNH